MAEPDNFGLPPAVPSRQPNARIFVAIEAVLPMFGFFCGALTFVLLPTMWQVSWVNSAILGLAMFVTGIQLQLLLMFYRIITYLIGFMTMADLLDATRILLTSLFVSGRQAPPRV